MEGWVGHVGWLIADGLTTKRSPVQLAVWCRIGKVRRLRPTFYPLRYTANTHKWNLTKYHFLFDGKKWKYVILMPETNTSTVSNHVLLTDNHVDDASGQWFFIFVASGQWVRRHVFVAEYATQQVVRHFHSRLSVCILKRILHRQTINSFGMSENPLNTLVNILEMHPGVATVS